MREMMQLRECVQCASCARCGLAGDAHPDARTRLADESRLSGPVVLSPEPEGRTGTGERRLATGSFETALEKSCDFLLQARSFFTKGF